MRRLVMWNLVTLDGFFEGAKSWDLGFHEYVWGEELERFAIEQLGEAEALLFGRVTYEGMAAYWSGATGEVAELMNAIPKYGFSRRSGPAPWSNSRLLVGDAADAVAALKREEGKDLFVFGSALLSHSLMERGLFDEYRLCLVPVVLGAGTPLFKSSAASSRLELMKARPLGSGAVLLYYRPLAEPEAATTRT
ncbi:MAG TPA: dihydrofolate reductase family protein [Rectinemataceae bacterium]|nr:dihydrofolate reductase family protein [Rectinemataceae bacterium]